MPLIGHIQSTVMRNYSEMLALIHNGVNEDTSISKYRKLHIVYFFMYFEKIFTKKKSFVGDLYLKRY